MWSAAADGSSCVSRGCFTSRASAMGTAARQQARGQRVCVWRGGGASEHLQAAIRATALSRPWWRPVPRQPPVCGPRRPLAASSAGTTLDGHHPQGKGGRGRGWGGPPRGARCRVADRVRHEADVAHRAATPPPPVKPPPPSRHASSLLPLHRGASWESKKKKKDPPTYNPGYTAPDARPPTLATTKKENKEPPTHPVPTRHCHPVTARPPPPTFVRHRDTASPSARPCSGSQTPQRRPQGPQRPRITPPSPPTGASGPASEPPACKLLVRTGSAVRPSAARRSSRHAAPSNRPIHPRQRRPPIRIHRAQQAAPTVCLQGAAADHSC